MNGEFIIRTMVRVAREKGQEWARSYPDKPKTKKQRQLAKEKGTPAEFADKCLAALGEISWDEAQAAVDRYLKEWTTP